MKVAAPLVIVLAVAGALVWFGQRSLIYFPDATAPGSASQYFQRGSDVPLRTADGLMLQAWRVDPVGSARDVAVLYLPGNGGNRLGRVSVAGALSERGFTVLLVDYRGYGGNPGKPSEDGLAHDADAAQAYLTEAGFPPEQIVYVGESIGTGVAAALAQRSTPAGLLLRSPYTSLSDVASHSFGGAPIGWLVRDRYDTLSRVPTIDCPITVLAGGADTTIPPAQSRQVAEAAAVLHEFEELPGVGHNDAIWFGPHLAEKVVQIVEARD